MMGKIHTESVSKGDEGRETYRRIKILGVRCNVLTSEDIISVIQRSVENDEKNIIANHNLHSIYLFHKNPGMKKFYSRSDYIHIDGMPVVFWSKLLGLKVNRRHRTTSVDWIDMLLRKVQVNGYRIFFLGGKPGVGEEAAVRLKERFPGINMTTHHGYFVAERASPDNRSIIEQINSNSTDILMVGMGMPRQELWISENYEDLQANVILPVGALMDYIAGVVPTPPRWMGRVGLEWLFRLIHNPVKFSGRYLVEPWYLIPYLIEDIFNKE